jgi:hypothetical protein
MIFAIAAELRSCDEDFTFVVQAPTTKELTLTIHKSILTTHPSPSRTSESTQTRGYANDYPYADRVWTK